MSISKLLLVVVPFPFLSAADITFNRDIAPLVYANCASCHHAAGVGPFPLISYQDVRRHASQIEAVTRRRYMPPWPPEAGYGDFAGTRRLTDSQIRMIAAWVQNGMPEGNAKDLPAPPQFSKQWQLGPPDLILRMAQPFVMQPTGRDVFRNFIIRSGLKEAKFVRGLELRLDNTRVVHHANVVLDRTRSLRHRDGEDGYPGFPGMDVITDAAPNEFDPDSHFLFWKPGTVLHPEPDGMSWRLDPNTDLILNLHLQATGKQESVQAEVGLYFTPQPPKHFPMLVQLEHDGAIKIPPGDPSFQVTDELILPIDSDVLAVYPHAHFLGKLVEAWATLPGGKREWLMRIPDWDINWQAAYEYRHPIALPKGTRLAMRITFDNSAANPRNPSHPPRRVTTGNLSTDEMGHVWFQLLPKPEAQQKEDPRLALQEAMMRRRLDKYPGDFLAHYNLAAVLQQRGKYDAASDNYRAAIRIEPSNVTAHNSLGGLLLLKHQVSDAIREFRESLRLEPAYSNARFNLAHTLAAEGELDNAESEYKEFLKQSPEDAVAQTDLATIYLKTQRYNEAIPHLLEAARLNPGDADVRANLGTVLAIQGHLPEAIKAFEDALRLNPDLSVARANLDKAKAELASKQ